MVEPSAEAVTMTAENSSHDLRDKSSSQEGKAGVDLVTSSVVADETPVPSQVENVSDSQLHSLVGKQQEGPQENVNLTPLPSSTDVPAQPLSTIDHDDEEVVGTQELPSQSVVRTATSSPSQHEYEEKIDEELGNAPAPALSVHGGILQPDTHGPESSGRTETTAISEDTTEVESTSTEQTSLTRSTVEPEQPPMPQVAQVSDASHVPEMETETKPSTENPMLPSSLQPATRPSLLHAYTVTREDALKKLVLIPEYLGNGMTIAIESEGAEYVDGPPGSDKDAPDKPILVFINAKSGGRLGPELEQLLVELIAPCQVFDLSKCTPTAVLKYGLGYLERAADAGDDCARFTRNNLRIMVAGGDGTVGWVLSSIADLGLKDGFRVPPVGVFPLGTGNDLARSLRWGGTFTNCTRSSVRRFLVKATEAKVTTLDSWQVVVKSAPSRVHDPLKLPHCMRPQHHVPIEDPEEEKHAAEDVEKEKLPEEVASSFQGSFYNYFSIGMDAQVAYGFHHFRDETPWLARGRVANQMVYTGYGCVQGWFCTACSAAPRARGIRHVAKLFVKRKPEGAGEWEELELPANVRAIIVLNLQSYAGGRNPWGHPSANRLVKDKLVEARVDDGMMEIVGLRDGWHTAVVLLELFTAVRLGQASAVRLELGGNRERAYMQMDGEPWQQPLGTADDPPCVVEIEKIPAPSIMLTKK